MHSCLLHVLVASMDRLARTKCRRAGSPSSERRGTKDTVLDRRLPALVGGFPCGRAQNPVRPAISQSGYLKRCLPTSMVSGRSQQLPGQEQHRLTCTCVHLQRTMVLPGSRAWRPNQHKGVRKLAQQSQCLQHDPETVTCFATGFSAT